MKRLKYILFAILIAVLFIVPSHADFGDYAGDYDYGGDYDYNYDYDDYDYDYNYDDDDYDYDNDDDDNYGGGYYYGGTSGGSSSSGGDSDTAFLGLAIIIVFFVMFYLFIKNYLRGKKKPGKAVMPGATPTSLASFRPMNEYKNIDPTFSEEDFTEKLSNLYVRFQNSWQDKKLDDIRPYLTDAFFSQADRQLDAYRRNHQTNRVERIAVLGVKLRGWKQEDGRDVILAVLQTRIVDYVVDDFSGNVVRGDANKEKFMTYEWTVQRSSGITSAQATGVTVQTCPHCGAQVNINHSAKCEYCDAVLTSDTFDWAISSIKGLSQRTAK